MDARQKSSRQEHCVVNVLSSPRNQKQKPKPERNPYRSDHSSRGAIPETQNFFHIGQMMKTVVSSVTYEHEKLKSELARKENNRFSRRE